MAIKINWQSTWNKITVTAPLCIIDKYLPDNSTSISDDSGGNSETQKMVDAVCINIVDWLVVMFNFLPFQPFCHSSVRLTYVQQQPLLLARSTYAATSYTCRT